MADRMNISLDKTAQSLWNKLEEEVNNTYDGGKSEFFRDMLMKYADDKTKLEAKKELLEGRIEALESQKDELELQLEAVENRLDDLTVEEEEQQKIHNPEDDKFWDDMVDRIMVRRSSEDPATVQARFNKWFEGNYNKYTNKYNSMPRPTFKEKFLSKAREKGFDEKVEKLSGGES